MKRQVVLALTALVLILIAGPVLTYGQGKFKVPFKFESGSQKFPAGDYVVTVSAEEKIIFTLISSGKEAPVPYINRLPQPSPPPGEPQLVFDAVGNFEPSYTEYFTVYVLAEVWLPGQDGFLVYAAKGAHQTQVVKGTMPVK
jgi:hypothetical protein